jgi:hypothetical protein
MQRRESDIMRAGVDDIQRDLWVAQRKAFDHRREQPNQTCLRACDTHFAKLRVGQELDVFDA